MFINKYLLVLTLAVCASAGNIPQGRSDGLQHRAIFGFTRNASTSVSPVANPLRKRALTKRCSAPSTGVLSSGFSSSAAPAKTAPASSSPPAQASPSPEPTAATTKAAPPANNEPSFLQGTQTGQVTYFTGPGACGDVSDDSTYVAAVSHLLFDAYPGYNGGDPASNPVCFKNIEAHYEGKSVTVTVMDRCTNCSLTDLDFSPAAFEVFADLPTGRLFGVTWNWLD